MLDRKSDILTVQRAQYINWCNNRNFLASPLVVPAAYNKEIEAKATSGRFVSLPPELLMEIFSYLDDNQSTMHSVSLVCKQWFYCAAPILYCHPQISDTYRWATFILTLTRERMSFFYGDLIRSIDLSSGKSIEAMKDQEFYRRLSDANDNNQQHQQQQQSWQRHSADGHASAMTTGNRMYVSSIQDYTNTESERRREEHDYVVKGLPFIIVSTSSLIQVSKTCKNLTTLNLSYTSLLHDSVIAETGEYLSTLQRYAVQPGLTHIQIPIEDAIEAIGKSCRQLEEVKIQRCEWVTAHVIWMFAYHCPNLKRLDARRSTKCTVKKLIANVLELPGYSNVFSLHHGSSNTNSPTIALPAFPLPQRLPRTSERQQVVVLEQEEAEEEHTENNNADDDEFVQIEGRDDGDASMLHFRFNDESGLWEREAHGPFRTIEMTAIEDNAEAVRNGTFWFVSLPNTGVEDDVHSVGRRPPSPLRNLSSQSVPPLANDASLKDIIRTHIIDCKDHGAIDLNWIQDYC